MKSVDKTLDAYALVKEFSQRSRRLEEKLIDQKVRLEIVELRQQRQQQELSADQSMMMRREGMMIAKEIPQSDVTQNASSSALQSPLPRAFEMPQGASSRPSLAGDISDSRSRGQLLESVPTSNMGKQPKVLALVRSEVEALRFVLDSGAKGATAKQIQSKIGRSREHTARMMNALFKEGLVERSSVTRPFIYRITEKGRKEAVVG